MIAETVLSGSLLLAMPLATAAGLVSFFSPCVLPLAPGYLSYVTGLSGAQFAARRRAAVGAGGEGGGTSVPVEEEPAPRRWLMLTGSALFVSGFTLVFMTAGAFLGGLGGLLYDHMEPIARLLGGVTVLLGLSFAGVLPGLNRELRFHRVPRAGLSGAPLLGVVFGFGWTACIGPTLAAVQSLAFTEGSALRGAILAFCYCLGLGLPFIAMALAYQRALGAFGVVRRHYRAVMRTGGGMLVLMGLLLLSGVWTEITAVMQGWITSFTPVI